MTVEIRRDGSVAFVTLKNPPVNAIGRPMRQGLIDALDWIDAERGLSRVVLSGHGQAFAAGADAREFDAPPAKPDLPDVIARIEACEIPWVAAINGIALGGGCELALGCRYRVAAPGVSIGLPEVTLGVVPGAGGTQRLPRLIGLGAALDMIATGRPVSSERAVELGLIEVLADDPVGASASMDIGTIRSQQSVGEMAPAEHDQTAIDAARTMADRKSANQIAPQRAIDLVVASAQLPFPKAMELERATFLELRQGEQARGLRHIFFAERGAKPPAGLCAEPARLAHIAVVGGGTMGAGIAYALLNAGMRVTLLETDADAVERATGNVAKIVQASLEKGLIGAAGAEDRRKRLVATHDYSQAADATLAIEAAFESMEVKRAVFSALQSHLPRDAVLATNTSYLDINEIAGVLEDPARLVGLHFFAPAHIMKLLEIVRGDATGDRALATGFALARRLRKVPVVAGVCDGFIGNRILARYREAADAVLLEGSTPWDIDRAMVEFGYAMGVYEAQDLSGLDIAHANRRRQDATRDPARRYVPIADRLVELGRLGRKTGAGWYNYSGGTKADDPTVAELAVEEAKRAKVSRRSFTADEIRRRLLLAMINEAAEILGEGIASMAADIDLVTVLGYGFPRWRGGLMHYADRLGAKAIVEELESLSRQDEVFWKPSTVLRRCAASGALLAKLDLPPAQAEE